MCERLQNHNGGKRALAYATVPIPHLSHPPTASYLRFPIEPSYFSQWHIEHGVTPSGQELQQLSSPKAPPSPVWFYRIFRQGQVGTRWCEFGGNRIGCINLSCCWYCCINTTFDCMPRQKPWSGLSLNLPPWLIRCCCLLPGMLCIFLTEGSNLKCSHKL